MTIHRHRPAIVTFPSDLEIVTTREFDAPIELVYDVLTRPEHVRHWFAPFQDQVTVCDIDLRVGGLYHIVFVTPEGTECSFRGTYLELARPTRLVDTWLFDGWPDAEAVETVELVEAKGRTRLTNTLAFRDQAGRDHMTATDGQEDSFDKLERYLWSLQDSVG
ncbi:MAG TPA: SRPBCC domain-containing protein [Acidimicrobiales bacterium]|nr:SRPBCC domain-containing protein [Acidimicrobiales bacterium]